MSEEIELAGEAIEAVANVLVEQSGVLGPVRQRAEFITKRDLLQAASALAREATLAAEKINRLGLPRAAINDPLVLRILEEGSWADDDDMQVAWSNLLANALTESRAPVHPAFRKVLGELEPTEVATLDKLADLAAFSVSPEEQQFVPAQLTSVGISGTGLDNLVRVGLLRYTRLMPASLGSISDHGTSVSGATFTDFGWAFVQACREPCPRD